MTLHAMPGSEGGLMARNVSQRPCTYHPPQWWDQGHEYNSLAKELCREECPAALFKQCQDGPRVFGMIKAGVLYDYDGKPEKQPCGCGNCRACKGVVADHHATIASMRSLGFPFKLIARRIGFTEDATRVYWHARGKYREEGKKCS